MKLAAGIIVTQAITKKYITDQALYSADGDKYVNLIRLFNDSDSEVIVNLKVLYGKTLLRLLKQDYQLAAGETKIIKEKIYLSEYDEIRCSASTDNVVQYIINGGALADEANDPSINIDSGASSGGSAGLTTISSPDSFTGETFFNYYFDYDVADLSFTDCIFRGTCYIKNIGGTITHTNSKGGLIFTNGDIVPGLKGYYGMDTADF